jgi:hypothetical protein
VKNAWRKSTHSFKDTCVEVGRPDNRLAVRDTKNPDGPQLAFDQANWDRFLARVRTVRG